MTEPERIEANMSSVAPAKTPPPPPPRDWTAAFLGYLVPGLGHIYQGRVGKGALFMICLYVLFFYGMYLGQGKNVYLPTKDSAGNELPDVPIQLGKFSIGPIPGTRGLMHRVQFLGQFWMGTVSWPAIIQYNSAEEPPVLGSFQRALPERELNELQRNGDKTWDLGWVFTVVAGVLNVLVMYDALAGPAFIPKPQTSTETGAKNAAATPAAAGR
jgi:hypothetical protein